MKRGVIILLVLFCALILIIFFLSCLIVTLRVFFIYNSLSNNKI